MALKPRNSVDDAFIDGLACAICTSTDLIVNHISQYPDFVACANCGSAFIVEHEGSWIMYGKIPSDYPETSEFALRQWTWLDAVRQRAEDERQASEDGSSEAAAEVGAELEPSTSQTSKAEEAIEYPREESIADSEDQRIKPAQEQPEVRPFGAEFTALEEPVSVIEDQPIEPAQEQPEVRPFGVDSTAFEEPDSPFEKVEHDEVHAPNVDPIADRLIAQEEEQVPDPHLFPATPRLEELLSESDQAAQDASMPIADEPLHQEQDEIGLDVEGDLGALMESPSSEDHSLDRLSTLMPEPRVEETLEEEYLEPLTEEDPEELEAKFEIQAPVGEPAKNHRFKVIVKGSELNFPKNVCAHCLRTPVVLGVTVNGTLPDFKRPGARSAVAFRLPLCEQDKQRAEARSEAEKNAVVQAHLISGVVAVFVVILFLVSGVVNPREELLISGLIMILLAILGYGISASILLGRANRFPPTHDAAYVLTTLRVMDDLGDLETAFEWRNQGYAELFRQVNRQRAVGDVERIADQVIIPDPEPSEPSEPVAKPPAEEVAAPVVSEGMDPEE